MEVLTREQLLQLNPELADKMKEIVDDNLNRVAKIKKRVQASEKYREFPKQITGADFKIRCSAIVEIMGNPQSKSPMLKWLDAKERVEKLTADLDDRQTKVKAAIDDNLTKEQGALDKISEYDEKLEGADMEKSANKKIQQTRANRVKYIADLKEKLKVIKSEGARKIHDLKTDLDIARANEKELFANKDQIHISGGAKTHLRKWLKEKRTGRRREIDTKYMYKGIEMEDAAIELYNKVTGHTGEKNEVRLYSEWMTGEFDHKPKTKDGKEKDLVVDIKCSWDIETYPLYQNTPPSGKSTPSKRYEMQLGVGYSHLLIENNMVMNIDDLTCELAYCLMNSPDEQISKEMHYKARNLGVERLTPDQEDKMFFNMNFDDIDDKEKVKRYRFKPDFEMIEQVKARVELCRRWIDEVLLKEQTMIVEIK